MPRQQQPQPKTWRSELWIPLSNDPMCHFLIKFWTIFWFKYQLVMLMRLFWGIFRLLLWNISRWWRDLHWLWWIWQCFCVCEGIMRLHLNKCQQKTHGTNTMKHVLCKVEWSNVLSAILLINSWKMPWITMHHTCTIKIGYGERKRYIFLETTNIIF